MIIDVFTTFTHNKMPLFSSKFAFKKAPQRQRQLESDVLSSKELENENNDSELDDDDEDGEEEEDQSSDNMEEINKDKKETNKMKMNRIRRPTSGSSISKETPLITDKKATTNQKPKKTISTYKNMQDKTQSMSNSVSKSKKVQKGKDSYSNTLTLRLDPIRSDHCFQFDIHQGIWKDMSKDFKRKYDSEQTLTDNKIENKIMLDSERSELIELRNRNKELVEDNRLLKLKIEILMEMVIFK